MILLLSFIPTAALAKSSVGVNQSYSAGYQQWDETVALLTGTTRIHVDKVKISERTLVLAKGASFQLSATVNPINVTNGRINWLSSNDSIVTVDSDGMTIAAGFGTATITAKASDNGKTATCAVRVFTPRTKKPVWGKTPFYPSDKYGIPWKNGNCVAYAYARACEILGYKPNIRGGDAKYWWTNNIKRKLFPYGSTPRVGAIAVWGDGGKNPATYSCGHVAIVEEIVDGVVYVSESGYGSPEFRYGVPKSTREFLGYIYLADFQEVIFG
jgi:surface antigen